MPDLPLLIVIAITIIFAITGFVFGKIDEKRHYRSITLREQKYQHILLFNEKHPPITISGQPISLVSGSVVISSDYFRQLVAGLIKIFGGRITSFESMLDRGRREAVLRMKEEAVSHGATMIFNVLFQTATLNYRGIVCAEFLAYGTAVARPK
jgi:uncharacterized protein YbjQ (UPF0145 family)